MGPEQDASSSDAGPHDDADRASDANGDANVCVTLSTTGFDKSCKQNADCGLASVGTVCSSGPVCTCAAEGIASSAESAYQTYYQNVIATVKPPPGGCMCPNFGAPVCIHGTCSVCGGAGPACPDGG